MWTQDDWKTRDARELLEGLATEHSLLRMITHLVLD